MIDKVDKDRGSMKASKDMADFVAGENSWRLSENFEKNCHDKCEFDLDEEIDFSEGECKSECCYKGHCCRDVENNEFFAKSSD